MHSGEFAGYKKDIATTAVHSRTGRRLQAQVIIRNTVQCAMLKRIFTTHRRWSNFKLLKTKRNLS